MTAFVAVTMTACLAAALTMTAWMLVDLAGAVRERRRAGSRSVHPSRVLVHLVEPVRSGTPGGWYDVSDLGDDNPLVNEWFGGRS